MKMSVEHWWNETDREKLTYAEKSLSDTNLTSTGLESNPGLRGERPGTNCLCHGTAKDLESNVDYI
jgi:hypothetical protein